MRLCLNVLSVFSGIGVSLAASSCCLRSCPASTRMYLSSPQDIAIEERVLLRLRLARALLQFGHVQSHSGTPPMEAVPRTVISVNYHPTSWVASCFIDQTRSPLTPGGASRWEGGGTEVTVSTRVVDSACPMPIEIRSLLKIFQPFGASSTRQDGWSSRHEWIK